MSEFGRDKDFLFGEKQESSENPLLDVIVNLRGLKDEPDGEVVLKIKSEDMDLLAGTADKDLETLARNQAMTRKENYSEFSEDKFRRLFIEYGELRARAQHLLGWEIPSDELD